MIGVIGNALNFKTKAYDNYQRIEGTGYTYNPDFLEFQGISIRGMLPEGTAEQLVKEIRRQRRIEKKVKKHGEVDKWLSWLHNQAMNNTGVVVWDVEYYPATILKALLSDYEFKNKMKVKLNQNRNNE